jgi:alpha-ketoglutarate-dependent taurine dioxygenase
MNVDGATVHDCITVHPESGAEVLFVAPMFVQRVEGLGDAASQALLAEVRERREGGRGRGRGGESAWRS